MADDYDKIAQLVRNGYGLEEALNQINQSAIPPASGTVTASMIDTSTLAPVVQRQRTDDGSVATGTGTIPLDNTIPQNTEGTEFLTVTITPNSSTNLLRVRTQGYFSTSAASSVIAAALFKDSDANALAAINEYLNGANYRTSLLLDYQMVAGSTSAITFKMRAGMSGAGTTTFNGGAGAAEMGGVYNSFIEVEEVLQ